MTETPPPSVPAHRPTVRRAVPGDEHLVRDVRLRALVDAPDAFTSTLERERDWTLERWRRWCTNGATFLLVDAHGVHGLAAGVPHDERPDVAFLMSMWVAPAHRGTGGTDALVDAVLAWARAEAYAEVLLDVGVHNHRARRVYERLGFRPTGGRSVLGQHGLPEIEMRVAIVPARDDGPDASPPESPV